MTASKDLTQQLKGLSHHAYCLVGGSAVKTDLISILEKAFKVKTRGNPDFFNYDYETFTIDDARQIKGLASTKPMTDSSSPADLKSQNGGAGKKFFVLQMNGITVEAQNALLKLLEEPGESVHFFLIIPSAHLLLPTVKSRLAIIQGERGIASEARVSIKGKAGGGSNIDSNRYNLYVITKAEEFIKLPVAKRLDLIKSLMDDISKEKRSKQYAVDFINAIQEAVHNGGVKKNAKALEAIETARTYMNDRAPSLKMLLEYIALSV
jgi:DNA polymerase III gamma/tau subunit